MSERQHPFSPDAARSFETELKRRVRGTVSFDPLTRGLYSTDASIYRIDPVAVVTPMDEGDAIAAVETAAVHGVSILPRGGGTSLAGQTVGASMVLDFSRHMNRVLEVNVEGRWARTQPGVVRDELNAAVAKHGLYFPIDPSTANRANIGGMIGNDAAGTRSIRYGKTLDHVLETRVLLADGTNLIFSALSADEYAKRASRDDREGHLLRRFRELIEANRAEIERRYPRRSRRVGGYNLDAFLSPGPWNLSKLITGSEGTLATLLEARLNLAPLPGCAALCIAHFDDLLDALRAVPRILEHAPSAVEILDRAVLTLAREHAGLARMVDFVEGDPAAILIIELCGDTVEDVRGQMNELVSDLKTRRVGHAYVERFDAAGKARVWQVRRDGLGIMSNRPGNRKPVAFIEDSSVPLEHLPDYIEGVQAILARHQVPMSLYAHASVGVIHVRPFLDLRRQDDIDRMKAIAEETFELVRKYEGAWSAEHGDGLSRSAFNERYFGPQVYRCFKDIKALFDPENRMNPGKIVDAPAMDRNLRYGSEYRVEEWKTEYRYRGGGGFAAAVELCTGIGACRKTLQGTMCPSYLATRDEEHSTRGRANALRLAMTGQLGPDGLASDRLFETMSLCLACKACKSECPSHVDMAKLKGEFLQRYHDRHGATLRDRVIARSGELASLLSGWPAPYVNRLQKTGLFLRLLERWAGFDRRRTLPEYACEPFPVWFARRNGSGSARAAKAIHGAAREGGEPRRVVLFDDTYMNYHEPRVGRAAVELLESCGYEVVLARAGESQRPRISRGFLREARRRGEETLRGLDAFIRQGLKVVVCEPSCASALTDDLPDLIDDEELAARIQANVMMIDVFLNREIEAGRLNTDFVSPYKEIVIHPHCHQESLFGVDSMTALLSRVPGLSVRKMDSGCCGMAGAFGHEKEHYALSMKIGESRLFEQIRGLPNGAALVACGFSCRHQIADGTGVKALHWVETLRGQLLPRQEGK